MVKLSEEKIKLLKDDIISLLYHSHLKPLFTNQIATELRRDNEFIKALLLDLENKGVVERVIKNSQGKSYSLRLKWRIPLKVRMAYEQSKEH